MVKWIVFDLLSDHCVVQEAPFGMKLLTNLDDCTGVFFSRTWSVYIGDGSKACMRVLSDIKFKTDR